MFEQGPSYPQKASEKAPKLEKEEGLLQKLSKIANRKFAILAIAFATSMAIERGIRAETSSKKPVAAETIKEKRGKIKIDTRIEKETEEGHILYIKGDQGLTEIEGVKGREIITLIQVRDEGDPTVKGDEFEVSKKIYRFDKIEGEDVWMSETKAKGTVSGEKNSFGYVVGFPESIQKAKHPDMEKIRVNAALQHFEMELKILRAFREIGKGDTEEAKYTQSKLADEVKKFMEKYPDIEIPKTVLKEIF
jgi:hypothetical protein